MSTAEQHAVELRDSDLAFPFRSGRLCLDFAATLGRRGTANIERLRSPDDLRRWAFEAPLNLQLSRVARADLSRARGLREAVYCAVDAVRRHRPPDASAVDLINQWSKKAPLPVILGADGLTLHYSSLAGPSCTQLLATLARDAVELLGSPLHSRIRECAADACTILFVDHSRGGNRRWCAMNVCGSTAKKLTFRRRHATTAAEEVPELAPG